MKYLIVGLGNPGTEYEGTRHNAGFMVLERLASRSSTVFSDERLGFLASIQHRGRTLLLLKPTTFMNLSGKAVNYWVTKEKIPLERLLIVVDDLALPVGSVRMRAKGSDAGHNGLKSIQQLLQTNQYPRLRIGIGNQFPQGHQIDYVLGRFTDQEYLHLDQALDRAVEGVLLFTTLGVERAMNQVNTTPPSQSE